MRIDETDEESDLFQLNLMDTTDLPEIVNDQPEKVVYIMDDLA